MSGPFLDPAANLRNEALLERLKKASTQEANIVPFASAAAKAANDGANPIAAIEDLLRALEGMQTQIQAMTELLCEQDKRIEKLERRKIIRGIAP